MDGHAGELTLTLTLTLTLNPNPIEHLAVDGHAGELVARDVDEPVVAHEHHVLLPLEVLAWRGSVWRLGVGARGLGGSGKG